MAVPSIPAVEEDDRPRWSVMIPAWNADRFLGTTIESVLSAGLPEGTQIEVVDDSSTDATESVAAGYASNGVAYFRHATQLGATRNFNSCIERARGELVHILHGDDQIVAGYYTAMDRAFADPNIIAAFCRTQYIDDGGRVLKATRSEGGSGPWLNAVATLGVSNRIRPPAIAVRRRAYEAVGGFRTDLHHAADWEMWMRLAMAGPIWFEDRVLARYRVHDSQDTSARIRSGDNIRERVAALQLVNAELPKSMLRKGLFYSAAFAGRTALEQARRGDWSAARTQLVAGARCGLAGLAGSVVVAGAQRS